MTAVAPTLPAIRRGWGRWLDSLGVMLRWQLTTLRNIVPLIIVVQILFGVGFAVGMGLFFPTMTEEIALYLATGAATVTLITVGIVLGPQLVAAEKEDGTYDFTWSLPVPRTATTAAWVVVNALFALPGAIAALLVAAWRYQIQYDMSWMVVPAFGLTSGGRDSHRVRLRPRHPMAEHHGAGHPGARVRDPWFHPDQLSPREPPHLAGGHPSTPPLLPDGGGDPGIARGRPRVRTWGWHTP